MREFQNKVHLIGIGGIGISALARYFLSEGWQVSGSDLSPSETTKELKNEGMSVLIGHHATNIKQGTDLVVYNQAIPSDNPELVKARSLGIPCKTYPEVVGELTKKYKTIAIAGAHGKSTTTALVSLILIKAGLDPTVIIGTKLKEFGGKNFRKGKGDWLVIEADEWKASFLNYFPTLAVITNIDKEHLDFYKNFSNVKKTFEKFKKQCETIVTASKNPKLLSKIKKVLWLPGQHNLSNALSAYAIAKKLKIPEAIILKALSKYRGAWRRMEYRGIMKLNPKPQIPGPRVYDDYAHHPTEIRATLAGFREKWPKNVIICVFQPHQVQRLKLLFNDFKTAFKDADKTVILPTYEVAGREKYAAGNLSEKLAKEIGAIYIKNPKRELKKVLRKTLLAKHYWLNPIVIVMGAGSIVNLTPKIIE